MKPAQILTKNLHPLHAAASIWLSPPVIYFID